MWRTSRCDGAPSSPSGRTASGVSSLLWSACAKSGAGTLVALGGESRRRGRHYRRGGHRPRGGAAAAAAAAAPAAAGALGPAGGGPAAAAGAPWCPLGRPARTRASRRRGGSRWAAVSDLRRARRRIGTFLRFRSSSSRRRVFRSRPAAAPRRGLGARLVPRAAARAEHRPRRCRARPSPRAAPASRNRSRLPPRRSGGETPLQALFSASSPSRRAAVRRRRPGRGRSGGAASRTPRGGDSGFQRLHLLHALHHLRLVPTSPRVSGPATHPWSVAWLSVVSTRLVYAKSTRNSSCQFSSRYTRPRNPTNSAVLIHPGPSSGARASASP